jgi:hypothetical protein
LIIPNTNQYWKFHPSWPSFGLTPEKRSYVMKTRIQSKILAIVAAAMIGLATTGGAALARGGGFGGGLGGGHIGGFGGVHMGAVGGSHVASFRVGHMGGLGVHPMGMPGIAMDRGLYGHGLGHTHISRGLGHHNLRGFYGASPLYDDNDCAWPADLTIESCPVGSATE